MPDEKVPDLGPRPVSVPKQPAAAPTKPSVALDLGPQSARMPEGRVLEVDEDDDGRAPNIALDLDSGAPRSRPRTMPRVVRNSTTTAAPRRGSAKWPWLLLVALLVGGGAALERTEHGAFFRHKIDALVHADERALLTQETIAKVRDAFGADTFDKGFEALTVVENAVARAPRHQALLGYAAYAFFAHELRFGRSDERHQRALAWLTRAGKHPNAALAAAARDLVNNEPEKARAALSGAPSDVEAKLLLGAIELATKHPQEGLRALEDAVKLEGSTRTRAALARALETLDAARAHEVATQIADESKTHVGARLILARLAYRARETKSLTQRVAELGPLERQATSVEKSELFTLRGLHALDRGEVVAARAAFDESVKLASGAPSVYTMVGLGDIELSSGKPAEARIHYDAAVSADPSFTRAKLGLAMALIALGQLDDARGVLDAITDPAAAADVAKLRAQAIKPKNK